MKASDIVSHLSAIVPRLTAGFSNSVDIISIIPSGNIATATTITPHGLVEGQNVAIIGAETPVEIDISSFLRTGNYANFKTLQDHDFTLSALDKRNGGKTLEIVGANEAEFNGIFQILRVIKDRKSVV